MPSASSAAHAGYSSPSRRASARLPHVRPLSSMNHGDAVAVAQQLEHEQAVPAGARHHPRRRRRSARDRAAIDTHALEPEPCGLTIRSRRCALQCLASPPIAMPNRPSPVPVTQRLHEQRAAPLPVARGRRAARRGRAQTRAAAAPEPAVRPRPRASAGLTHHGKRVGRERSSARSQTCVARHRRGRRAARARSGWRLSSASSACAPVGPDHRQRRARCGARGRRATARRRRAASARHGAERGRASSRELADRRRGVALGRGRSRAGDTRVRRRSARAARRGGEGDHRVGRRRAGSRAASGAASASAKPIRTGPLARRRPFSAIASPAAWRPARARVDRRAARGASAPAASAVVIDGARLQPGVARAPCRRRS